VLKLLPDGSGYLRLSLAGATRHVHRLVLEAFDRPCPPGMEVLHGPGGRTDNRLANLRYGTRSENLGADKHRDGTMAYAKLDEMIVLACIARHASGESYAVIAADYGVTKITVWNAVNGKSWRHVGHARLMARPQPRASRMLAAVKNNFHVCRGSRVSSRNVSTW